jgi:transposase InsO family protein
VTVRALIEWFGCPVDPALDVLDLAHSSYYYHSQKAADRRLEADMQLVAGLKIERTDQVWVCDITYLRLGQGFVYLAVIMDVFTRAIRGWNLSRNLDMRLTLDALNMALQAHTLAIHHSDQGVQYAASEYVRELQNHKVLISMAAVGKPEENGYAERLMITIKEEEVDLSDYRDFADADRQIRRFLEDVYMTKRIHSSLGYLTPAEFEAALRPAAAVAATP